MSNAVTAALNSAFSVDSPSELADHVMYCLPPKVKFDGIAYAFVNNWNSVYNDDWCTYPKLFSYILIGTPFITTIGALIPNSFHIF